MTYSPEWWAFVESLPSEGVTERHMAHVRARIAEFSAWATEPSPRLERLGRHRCVVFAWGPDDHYADLDINEDDARTIRHGDGAHVALWLNRDEPLPADFRAFVEAMHPAPELHEDEAWGVE